MMAPAMNTCPDERLPYLELARQGARVERTVQAADLQRLADIAPGQGPLQAQLDFHLDANGRPWVTGTASICILATCQGCLEERPWDLAVEFDLCIARDPDVATALAQDADVLVADADTVSVAEVVEDELILSLPERLCTEIPCPLAPARSHPAEGGEPAEVNPFQVLSVLKQR